MMIIIIGSSVLHLQRNILVCVCVPWNDGNKDNVFRESKQQVNNNDDGGGDDTGYILLLFCKS